MAQLDKLATALPCCGNMVCQVSMVKLDNAMCVSVILFVDRHRPYMQGFQVGSIKKSKIAHMVHHEGQAIISSEALPLERRL